MMCEVHVYAECGRRNTPVTDVSATIYRLCGRWNTIVADVIATILMTDMV